MVASIIALFAAATTYSAMLAKRRCVKGLTLIRLCDVCRQLGIKGTAIDAVFGRLVLEGLGEMVDVEYGLKGVQRYFKEFQREDIPEEHVLSSALARSGVSLEEFHGAFGVSAFSCGELHPSHGTASGRNLSCSCFYGSLALQTSQVAAVYVLVARRHGAAKVRSGLASQQRTGSCAGFWCSLPRHQSPAWSLAQC